MGSGSRTHDDANTGAPDGSALTENDRPPHRLRMRTVTAWVRKHDANLVALRRAARTAIIMPGLFALSIEVIGDVQVATFAAFGSIALLMLVDFSGPMHGRLQAQAAISVTGAIFVCLGTLTSQTLWLSVVAMGVVAFIVIFAGVVSSVLASSTTSLILVFILSTAVPASPSVIPDRLAGWSMAAVVAFVAVWLLWPAKVPNNLRNAAANACRALAARLRADASFWLGETSYSTEQYAEVVAVADAAVDGLHRNFLAAPWRPTGLSISSRAVVRLVDELLWMGAQLDGITPPKITSPVIRHTCQTHSSSAAVLQAGADLLDQPSSSSSDLDVALRTLDTALGALESEISLQVPIGAEHGEAQSATNDAGAESSDHRIEEFVKSLDPSFRAQEIGFAAHSIGTNIDLAVAADRRSWLDAISGVQPGHSSSRLSSARERAAAHLDRHSVWLHNSVRGAVGLAVAVFVSEKTGLQHSFWVILGALSVLRSNALNTGQNALRAIVGTVIGFVAGAGLLVLVGTNTSLLWFLLPLALLVAGFAPTAISFAAGQAGFTLSLVILFNLLQPAGWRVGLYRVEDIAIGSAVSVGVGLLFWPRGAAAALSSTLRQAYVLSATYLEAAVNFSTEGNDGVDHPSLSPAKERTAAAAASRRLDDALRTYLAERNSKPFPLPEVTALLTGVANLRQTGDAVISLWESDDARPNGDQSSARDELSYEVTILRRWYERLGAALVGEATVPVAALKSETSDRHVIEAVRDDLRSADGPAAATAVRLIWTRDYLEATRRDQRTLVEPAQVVAANPATPQLHLRSR
jgi:uncharacterized membrane protein YccC